MVSNCWLYGDYWLVTTCSSYLSTVVETSWNKHRLLVYYQTPVLLHLLLRYFSFIVYSLCLFVVSILCLAVLTSFLKIVDFFVSFDRPYFDVCGGLTRISRNCCRYPCSLTVSLSASLSAILMSCRQHSTPTCVNWSWCGHGGSREHLKIGCVQPCNFHPLSFCHFFAQDRWSLGAPQASYERRRHRNCFQTGPVQAFPKK